MSITTFIIGWLLYYLTVWWCRKGEEKHEAALAQEWIIHRGPHALEPHACPIGGHVSGDASGPCRLSLRRRQRLRCLYLNKTRLETQNLHTTVQLGVKVGCSCNQLTSILHVLVTCWHFFRLGMNTNVLNGAAFRACTFSVSNVCNKCTKQTPSCWLAGMWKIGVCSESLADLGGDC